MFLPFFHDWQAGDGRLEISHATLAELREKNLPALTNKSSIGIVLDGTRVLMVVPGSPSCFPNENGERIEIGDTIYAIDGEQVTEADIVSKMIGTDDPGSTVVLTVLKKSPVVEYLVLFYLYNMHFSF
jgi:C-terminal processing protease CtpA/Prc